MERSDLIACVREEGYAYNFTPGAAARIVDRDDLEHVIRAVEPYEDIDTITEEIVDAVHDCDALPGLDWGTFQEMKARSQLGQGEDAFREMVRELRGELAGAEGEARLRPLEPATEMDVTGERNGRGRCADVGADATAPAGDAVPVGPAGDRATRAAPDASVAERDGGDRSAAGVDGPDAGLGRAPADGDGGRSRASGGRAPNAGAGVGLRRAAAAGMVTLAVPGMASDIACAIPPSPLIVPVAPCTALTEADTSTTTASDADAALVSLAPPTTVTTRVLGSSRAALVRGDLQTTVRVLMEHRESFEPRGEVKDFVNYFSSRYRKVRKLIERRRELVDRSSLMSIERAVSFNASGQLDREDVSVIGIVSDRAVSKNGHIMLTLEDATGSVRVMLLKDRKELVDKGASVVLDEVIGVRGGARKDVIFAKDIVFPDVPCHNPFPRTEEEVYVAFISDTHVGSNAFRPKEFERFLAWLRGEWGSEAQRAVASRVGYLLVAGDLVDGIGVYKGQDKELAIPDIYRQYEEFANYLERVPEGVQTVIIPGNHDISREAEPQPAVFREFARGLYERDRFILSSNPCLVRVHDAVDVLMYHGASLDSMIDALPHLKDGYNKPQLVMEELIRKRHLNPIYGHKTRIFPENEDLLVIDRLPNVLHAGHVHTIGHACYRDILLVNSGTFQGRTEFQVRLGHQPTPGIIPLLNLRTGDLQRVGFGVASRGAA